MISSIAVLSGKVISSQMSSNSFDNSNRVCVDYEGCVKVNQNAKVILATMARLFLSNK